MMSEPQPPPSFRIHNPSPLDNLVRRASAKRDRLPPSLTTGNALRPQQQPYTNATASSSSTLTAYPNGGAYGLRTPPRRPFADDPYTNTPDSPLLHGHFRGASNATASEYAYDSSFDRDRFERDDNSYLDMSMESGGVDHGHGHISSQSYGEAYGKAYGERFGYRDEETRGAPAPALRDSWESGTTAPNIRSRLYDKDEEQYAIYPTGDPPPQESSPVPTVVVSEAGDAPRMSTSSSSGRAPIVTYSTNYSRPVRQQLAGSEPRPELPPEDQKYTVLERNAGRVRSPLNSPASSLKSSSSTSLHDTPSPSPYTHLNASSSAVPSSLQAGSRTARSTSPFGRAPSPASTLRSPSPSNHLRQPNLGPNHSPTPPASRSLSPSASPGPQPSSPSPSELASPAMSTSTAKTPVTLSRRPPSFRSHSPATSVYSTYSFYNLDNAPSSGASTPSPTGNGQFPSSRTPSPGPNKAFAGREAYLAKGPAVGSYNPRQDGEVGGPRTASDFLQLGIQHHEANRLVESAKCFERSAELSLTEKGGDENGVGMLMWGLALRHGWGCQRDEKKGFEWLQRAADGAVRDLEGFRASMSEKGQRRGSVFGINEKGEVKEELVLAVYEVGQCFFHGWGVPKDQKMGVSYYTVAAKLGDADAQSDLGFCLANGKGCKKDRKEAAKWYRAAVAQGQSDIGLAWIYKEKFR